MNNNYCKHNTCVDCFDKSKCSTCGWDPRVRKERVSQLRRERTTVKRTSMFRVG